MNDMSQFQFRVHDWMLDCFGSEVAADRRKRGHRFLEESLELSQAIGCTREEAHQLVDYVFGRATGDAGQEVGGVMLTLAALCTAIPASMLAEGEIELRRVNTPEMISKIRAKHMSKPIRSPLPGHGERRMPGTRYLNRVDGKIYEFVSEDNDTVTFRREGRDTPHYLGQAEFASRFERTAPALEDLR